MSTPQAWVNLYVFAFYVSGENVVAMGFDDTFIDSFSATLISHYGLLNHCD